MPNESYWLARGDYSQIEARVNPWLAGAEWKLDAFRRYDAGTGPDLYLVTAARILGIPVDLVSKLQRQAYGKVPELALGYQGGVHAFLAMAKTYGVKVTEAQADEIKVAWRAQNPEICALWRGLDYAALQCMRAPVGEITEVWTRGSDPANGLYNDPIHLTPLKFQRRLPVLTMIGPSGGRLHYWTPVIRNVPTPWGYKDSVVYRAEDSVTKRWTEFTGYGGLWCQNVVSFTSRELMADSLIRMADDGLSPRLTVHDEGVCRVPRSQFPRAEDAARAVETIMRQTPAWAAGLPVAADASAAERYVKV